MALVNRALSGNINIHCDHSDSMGGRDAGWIHHFCENAQEAYDTALINFRISEHMDVRLPAMVNYDGFIVSHKEDALYLLDDGPAYDFIGPYRHKYTLLDPAHPITVGPLDLTDYYFEHKFTQLQAYPRVFDVAKDVFAEFGALTGRHYGLWEEYRLDDADLVMIVLGSSAGTAKDVIDEYREKGVKVGLLKLRMFRPFPAEQLRPVLAGRRAIAVLDRSASFGGWGGPVFNEVRSALYGNAKPAPIHNWLYGLGGRDFELGHAAEVIESLQKIAAGHELPTLNLLGCRA